MEKLPTSAKALNSWIEQHFAVFQGPSRAYFELPFEFKIGTDNLTHHKRIVFYSYAFTGLQEDCCIAIVRIFEKMFSPVFGVASSELLQDACIPIFIRTPFIWDSDKNTLYGRFAFWNDTLNNYFKASLAYKTEGELPRRAPRDEEG